ncbi:MAG: phosphoribosyltransferase [Deltaproteobacteria bacterium]|nr:phosphoribosyltransferase [Deltaproteobacteria bacterium]
MGKLRIVSYSREPFSDRVEAGRLLARELDSLRGRNPVILGIPRGGIIPARELALALNGRLDVILSHKLRMPGRPEVAMGAIAEGGVSFVDPEIVRLLGITVQMIEQEKHFQLEELNRRSEKIRQILPRVPLENRQVIITDDGVATGATTRTAIRAARFGNPARLILALPVGPEDTVSELAEEADETICLRVPLDFMAVGQFYRSFEQVSDQEMLDILKEARRREEEK